MILTIPDRRAEWRAALQHLATKPTESQEKVILELLDWFFSEDAYPFAMLNGPAGTGKSWVAGAFLATLGHIIGRGRLIQAGIIAAPTHRAVKVAQEKLRTHDLHHFKHYTTARLTGMRARIDSRTGVERFTPEGENAVEDQTELIAIDEVSMVNREMAEIIEELVDLEGVRCLLIGDNRQLPPVKEKLNPFFTKKDIPRFELTEVVRHDGPVLQCATATRAMTTGRPVFETVGDGAEVFVTSDRVKFHRMLREAFADVDHAQPDSVQALAWRRDRVAELNQHARRQLYGTKPPKLVEGELLISTEPINVGGDSGRDAVLAPTSTYVRVVGLEHQHVDITSLFEDAVETDEKVLMKTYRVHGYCPDMEEHIHFNVVHEDDQDDYDLALKALKKAILAKPESIRRDWWRENYYPLKNWNAPVQSACAMTTHRAQGTTLHTAFIDLGDMDRCQRTDPEFHNRIVYTALTRASHRLVIFDPKAPRN